MKGLILLFVVGACYCSHGNFYIAKYCNISDPGQREGENVAFMSHSIYKNPVSLVEISRDTLTNTTISPWVFSAPTKPTAKPSRARNPGPFNPKDRDEFRDLIKDTDRFKSKHTFMNGKLGKKIKSYDWLTESEVNARRYLIELNRIMFNGQVLPATISSNRQFSDWWTAAKTNPKKVSLLDASLSEIEADIKSRSDYQAYLEALKKGEPTPKFNNFETKNKYFQTLISSQVNPENENELVVTIKKFEAKLTVGMKGKAIYHYDKSEHHVATTEEEVVHHTKFTRDELLTLENLNKNFYESMFGVDKVGNVKYVGALNEDSDLYKKWAEEYKQQYEEIISPDPNNNEGGKKGKNTGLRGTCSKKGAGRKKRAGSVCAFDLDSEGEIESIHPEEFLEVYKETPEEEGRRKMVDSLKNNGDKYIFDESKDGLAARKQLNQLIHHDEMTIHAELVETTGTIQDSQRWGATSAVPEKPSEIVTAISEAVSTRMDKVKLSASKVVHSLSNNRHVIGIAKAAKPYGNLMMAKGLINGIIHNDTTAIAVIGSRLGYDVVTEVGVDVGTKFFSEATKVGKGARVLGKVAGPIGAVVDIGLGAWSLYKSVNRLEAADNQYDRDDAIADVVEDSIGIAVGVTALVLSVAFPPAAPLIFAATFVISVLTQMATSLFKAGNEVSRINSEIPLSGAEKSEVFASRFFDFFGLRGKDYIDYLVEEKHANDLAVQNYLNCSSCREHFSGVLFPSRSLTMDDNCTLHILSKCPGKTIMDFIPLFGGILEATVGNPNELFGGCQVENVYNCPKNGPCFNDGRVCVDDHSQFTSQKCQCDDNNANPNFGGFHADSDVDFRQKRKVYWERSVPGDVSGVDFKCKPSYLEYTDYHIQQSESRNEYHCFHAIGLNFPQEREQDKTNGGKTFLVNLDDGKDTVVTDQESDETPYTFWLGEQGEKSFWGGNKRNEFILNGNCSEGLLRGNLYGGPKATNSLIVGPNCAKGQIIQFVNQSPMAGNNLIVYLRYKLDLKMGRVENIIGRPNDAESVQVACNTRKLFLNGGANTSNPDSITVGSLHCHLDLVTVLGNHTDFSSRALMGEITIYVGQDMEGSSINVVRPPGHKYKNPKTTIIFTDSTAEMIDIQKIRAIYQGDLIFNIWDSSSHTRDPLTVKYSAPFSSWGTKQHQLFFNESTTNSPNTFSVLLIPANEKTESAIGPMQFFHNLQENQASMETPVIRTGNSNIPNLFNISGSNWDLRGGSKDDIFLLYTDINRVIIDGKGGHDMLIIQQLESSLINLNGNDKLKGIETIVKGDKIGRSLEVSTGCDTKAVVTKGDDSKFPDTVTIHNCTGDARELQIDAGGWSSVIVDGDLTGENEIVRVVAHRTLNTPVKFKLETGYAQAVKMLVHVELSSDESKTLRLRELSKSQDGKSFRAILEGGGGVETLDFNLRINDDDGFYLTTPQIQLQTGYASQLVFQRYTLEPVAVHVIEKNDRLARKVGFEQLQNLYQIESGFWTIVGGGVKDTFVGGAEELSKTTIKPNANSDNTLVINYYNSDYAKPFHVDLQEEKMGWKGVQSWYDGKIVGGYIQHVIGRPNQSDVITTGCVVKSVVGRGGADLDNPDLIVIKDHENCESQQVEMEVHLGRFTKVENSAQNGSFKYFVNTKEPLADNSFAITPTGSNQHKIVFQDKQPSQFTSITFDQYHQKLYFRIWRLQSHSQIEFPMYRPDEQSDYINPKFLLTSNDNFVRDVRVDNGGNVVATALLDSDCVNNLGRSSTGLPVDINNFLINITTQADTFRRCDTMLVDGQNSQSCHFWLYGISDYNRLTIVGDRFRTDSVRMGNDFLGNQSITANFSAHAGYLSIPGRPNVDLWFIDTFVGRSNPVSYDTVIPSCYTKQVSGVDLVDIKIIPSKDCAYNLIIGMEPETQVNFEWNGNAGSGPDDLSEFWNSTFHYRFTEPMSFEVEQSYPGLLDGTEHILYLPFNLDEMETLSFDIDENQLYYTIDRERYSITMISEPGDEDQFYPQPTMVTHDGLRILVGRDASLLISGELKGSNSAGQELLEQYQDLANTLRVTMVIKTDVGLFHLGHCGADLDRNVVQNVAYSDSYMSGGGALGTIYEVVSLNKNVYIATGLNDEVFDGSSVNTEGPYSIMQTLDLTDIVSPIRYQTMKKYIPVISQAGDNLVITMEGHLRKYPGKIVIFGGVSEIVREKLQVLLSHAMMKIILITDAVTGNSWKLVPIPVQLKRETVSSLSAEDLEYDHYIKLSDHLYGPEYHFRFNYSKHGNDLHLSDIEEFRNHRYDEKHIEMTTVIITDFYKKLNAEQVSLTKEGNSSYSSQGDGPAEIVNVTLELPGLKIKLDGTDVILLSDKDEMPSPPTLLSPTTVQLPANGSTYFTPSMAIPTFSSPPVVKDQAPVLLSPKDISEWTTVLHQVEQEILEELPFEHRIY